VFKFVRAWSADMGSTTDSKALSCTRCCSGGETAVACTQGSTDGGAKEDKCCSATFPSAATTAAAAAAALQATHSVTGMLLEVLLYLLCYCLSRPHVGHAVLQCTQQHNHRLFKDLANQQLFTAMGAHGRQYIDIRLQWQTCAAGAVCRRCTAVQSSS
jgi:hypothetical protein